MKLCPGTLEAARPQPMWRLAKRGFCPVCRLAVNIHPNGDCKRHYPNGAHVKQPAGKAYRHFREVREDDWEW